MLVSGLPVFLLGPLWFNLGFSLALTVCGIKVIFFASSKVLICFDCVYVMLGSLNVS